MLPDLDAVADLDGVDELAVSEVGIALVGGQARPAGAAGGSAATGVYLCRLQAGQQSGSSSGRSARMAYTISSDSAFAAGYFAGARAHPEREVVKVVPPAKEAASTSPEPPSEAPPIVRDPVARLRHDEELRKYLKLAKDPDPGISFGATVALRDLKDLRAVPVLVDVLKDSARGTSGRHGAGFRATLVVGEIALDVAIKNATEKTRLVFDCGLGSMKRTRAALLGFPRSMGG